jgi:hypothetical protein
MSGVERAVEHLIGLGYLKYVPLAECALARQEMIGSLSQGYLDTEWNRQCVSRDRRSYPADSEELAEGRTGEFILLMKDVLRMNGISLDSVEDSFRDEQYDVFINGRRSKIYDSAMSAAGDSWGIATKRHLDIVNELLLAAGSQERLYGIYAGNDGRCILLTTEMREYLKSPALRIDSRWMPFPAIALRDDGKWAE